MEASGLSCGNYWTADPVKDTQPVIDKNTELLFRCSLVLLRGWPSNRGSVILGYPLENRTQVFDNEGTRGSEFLRKVKAVAKRKGLAYRWDPQRGVGSHGTLYLGDRFTVVKDLKKELGPGLLADICKQLGIRKEDL